MVEEDYPGSSKTSLLPMSSPIILPHTSHNPKGTVTILLLHGAFSSPNNYFPTLPYFPSDYHILLPSLPGHAASAHISPFTMPNTSHLLAHLIRTHAKNVIAHIVGMSLGAQIAIHLASNYPDLVDTVFVSGFEVFPTPAWLDPIQPYIIYLSMWLEDLAPRPLVRWLMDGIDIKRSDKSFCTLSLCRQMCSRRCGADPWPQPWPTRTLVIAAGKRGILPTADHPHDANRLAEIGRRGNSQTRAVVAVGMRHPWSMQAPEVWAKAVVEWVERGEVLKEGFVDL